MLGTPRKLIRLRSVAALFCITELSAVETAQDNVTQEQNNPSRGVNVRRAGAPDHFRHSFDEKD